MNRFFQFLTFLALLSPVLGEEKTKEVVITPGNQAAHRWTITHAAEKSADGTSRHFFNCILRLPGEPLIPYKDEMLAEVRLVKNGQNVIRYEPRVWVNARPNARGESNYSIKLELAESAISNAEVGMWLNERGHTDTNFIIRLRDFPTDPEK